MDVKDFYFDLPEELIAQDPLKDRSSSRLLVQGKCSTGYSGILWSIYGRGTAW